MNYKPKKENIIACILYTIFGIMFLVFRTGLLNVFMTIVGVVLILLGIFNIIAGGYVKGIIEAALGITLIVCGWLITKYVLILLGVLIVFEAVADIIRLIRQHRVAIAPLLEDIVYIAAGILLFVAPFKASDIICIIVGVLLIIVGIIALFCPIHED